MSELAKAAVAIGKLEKDRRNKHGGYNYLSERAVKAAVRHHVAGSGLLPQEIQFEIISDEWHPYGKQGNMGNFVKVRCTLRIMDDKSMHEAQGLGAGVDYADKALMKAQTSAIREAWKNLLVISDGNDPESDEIGDEQRPPPQTKPKSEPDMGDQQVDEPKEYTGPEAEDPGEGDPRKVKVPFGKNKGIMLGHLKVKQLGWYAEKAKEDWLRAAATKVLQMKTADIDPTPPPGPEYPEDNSDSWVNTDEPQDDESEIPF